MKLKNASIFLMVSSIIWLLADIYWAVQRFIGPAWNYYKEQPIEIVLQTLMIIVPISLLVLAIALINHKPGDLLPENENQALVHRALENSDVPSIGDWLLTFLVRSVPFVGFICMILWANNDTNMVRKNWAIASLIWSVILLVVFVLLYAVILSVFRHNF